MREILFRGKRVDNGNWIEGSLFIRVGECYIIPLPIITSRSKVIPKTVGRYIGLKDKNGKMIFEGDIVCLKYCQYNFDGSSTEHRSVCGTIAYDAIGMLGIIVELCEGVPVWSDFFNVLSLTDNIADWSIEVIGNIHDNSELAERESNG